MTRLRADADSVDGIRAVGGSAWIVGSALVGSGDAATYLATIWRSTDGTSWSRSVLDGGAKTPAAFIADVARHAGRYVVVGCLDNVPCAHPVVWRSSDGTRWQRTDAKTGFDGSNILSIASSGGRLVGIGAVCLSGATGATPSTGAVLARSGGETAAVAATTCAERSITGDPVVWESSDGINWTSTGVPPAAERLQQVLATDDGLIAVGFDADGRSAVWRRRAVQTGWEPVSSLPASFVVRDVAATPDGLIAVGTSALASEPGPQVIRYRDGGDWTSDGPDKTFEFGDGTVVNAVVSSGQQTIAVGSANRADPADPQNQLGAATVWLSTGDRTWIRAGPGPEVEQDELVDAVVVAGRLIAIDATGGIWSHPLPF